MGELRESLRDNWLKATRNAHCQRRVWIEMSHPVFAGMLLTFNGSAAAALDACPPEPWFDVVRDMLKAVAEEDVTEAGSTVIRLPLPPKTQPLVSGAE